MAASDPLQRSLAATSVPRGEAALAALWQAIAALPAGEVASYGEVARRAGLPGRARLAARALRLAPDSLQLPWHRVVAAGLRIAFAPGSRGFRLQRSRLQAEGHRIDARGRLVGAAAAVDVDIDAALWAPPD
ncbi:MAG: MGMT family protein [Xanthomonadales bacterium]|nr:MGMT family protein [Xanthomonadales bacterium]